MPTSTKLRACQRFWDATNSADNILRLVLADSNRLAVNHLHLCMFARMIWWNHKNDSVTWWPLLLLRWLKHYDWRTTVLPSFQSWRACFWDASEAQRKVPLYFTVECFPKRTIIAYSGCETSPFHSQFTASTLLCLNFQFTPSVSSGRAIESQTQKACAFYVSLRLILHLPRTQVLPPGTWRFLISRAFINQIFTSSFCSLCILYSDGKSHRSLYRALKHSLPVWRTFCPSAKF